MAAEAGQTGAGGAPGPPDRGPPKPALPKVSDPVFEELVFRLLERREQAGELVLEQFCAEHPAWAERLRARIGELHAGELHAGGLLGGEGEHAPPGSWREVDLRSDRDHSEAT